MIEGERMERRRLYTVGKLAEVLGKHRNTIYRWIEEGVFPEAFKVKKGWYVLGSDLERLRKGPQTESQLLSS